MPEPQTQDKVRVLGPDNRHYLMPPGTTKDQAIAYFKKKGIVSAESPRPKTTSTAPAPVGPAPAVIGAGPGDPEKRAAQSVKEHPFLAGSAEGWGLDPKMVAKYGASEAFKETVVNFGKMVTDVIHDPKNVGSIVDGLNQTLRGAEHHILHGSGIQSAGPYRWSLGPSDVGEMERGAGMALAAFGQILGGSEGLRKIAKHVPIVDGAVKVAADIAQAIGTDPDEAMRVAYRSTTGIVSKIIRRQTVAGNYLHYNGLDVGKDFGKASAELHAEVVEHADGIAREIDGKIPSGVIDARSVATKILDNFKEEVKAPEKVHPALASVLKDASATAPGLWTWEKVRQFRSSIGRAMSKVAGPQGAVLTQAYADLTKQLGDIARKYKLGDSWEHYNELERKTKGEFGDIINDLKKAKTGHEVAQILNRNIAFTSELARNLSKYGLDYNKVMKYADTSARIIKQSTGWKGTLFRMAYGTPAGVPVMLAGRVGGLGWIGSVAAGAAVGYLATYLTQLGRTLRLSTDVIERLMNEREIPGPMKFEKGVFPSGEEPTPSTPSEAPKPRLPAPKTSPAVEKTAALAEESTKPSVKKLVRLSDTSKPKEVTPQGLVERRTGSKEAGPRAKLINPDQRLLYYDLKKSLKDAVGRDREIIEAQIKDIEEQPFGDKKLPYDVETAKVEKRLSKEEAKAESAKRHPEVTKTSSEEVGREPGAKPGTTRESKLGRQTKARERVAKVRKEKGSTALGGGGQEISGGDVVGKTLASKEIAEAQTRASADPLNVSSYLAEDMEELIRKDAPDDWELLQKVRKEKNLSDMQYRAGLEYITLNILERIH